MDPIFIGNLPFGVSHFEDFILKLDIYYMQFSMDPIFIDNLTIGVSHFKDFILKLYLLYAVFYGPDIY